jgi:hypothetical protein
MPTGDALSLTTRNYALIKANIDELTICDEDNNLLVIITTRPTL